METGFLDFAVMGTVAGMICGAVDVVYGATRNKLGLGLLGFFFCSVSGFLLGLLLAIPMMGVFLFFIHRDSAKQDRKVSRPSEQIAEMNISEMPNFYELMTEMRRNIDTVNSSTFRQELPLLANRAWHQCEDFLGSISDPAAERIRDGYKSVSAYRYIRMGQSGSRAITDGWTLQEREQNELIHHAQQAAGLFQDVLRDLAGRYKKSQ